MPKIPAKDLKSQLELRIRLDKLREINLQNQTNERRGEQQQYIDTSIKYKPLIDVSKESAKEIKEQMLSTQDATSAALVPISRELTRRNDITEDLQELAILLPEPKKDLLLIISGNLMRIYR